MAKHNRDTSFKKTIIFLLAIITVMATILTIQIKSSQNKDDQQQEQIAQILDTIDIPEENITPETPERVLQVRELQKENTEVIGWIQIDGTNINYPVCQGQDNDYYLTHTYQKEKNANGSIFLDKDYDFTRPSENLLIYGHRNKKSLMFDELVKYKDEAFYKEHPTIRFTTAKSDDTYEIISVFKSRVYYQDEQDVFRYYQFVNAESLEEQHEYIQNAKEASLYEIPKSALVGDQLLTLSTCDYEVEDGRFVIMAVKSK